MSIDLDFRLTNLFGGKYFPVFHTTVEFLSLPIF